MKAATGAHCKHFLKIYNISIHAAREGGDTTVGMEFAYCVISIHAAREGGDHVNKSPLVNAGISIHAAREGGDSDGSQKADAPLRISIHAAREGGDFPALPISLQI